MFSSWKLIQHSNVEPLELKIVINPIFHFIKNLQINHSKTFKNIIWLDFSLQI